MTDISSLEGQHKQVDLASPNDDNAHILVMLEQQQEVVAAGDYSLGAASWSTQPPASARPGAGNRRGRLLQGYLGANARCATMAKGLEDSSLMGIIHH